MIAFAFMNEEERVHPKPAGYEAITVTVTGKRLAAALANACICALVSFEGGPCRMRMDGGVPTANDGHLRVDGSEYFLSKEEAQRCVIILDASASSATLRVTYYA